MLMERTPQDLKPALMCELGDEAVFHALLTRNIDVAKTLSEADRQKLSNAAQSNNTKAVRLMLGAGWPPGGCSRGDESDGAIWGWIQRECGNGAGGAAVPPDAGVEIAGESRDSILVGLVRVGKRLARNTGGFVSTIRELLEAGAVMPPDPEVLEPSDAVLEVLR